MHRSDQKLSHSPFIFQLKYMCCCGVSELPSGSARLAGSWTGSPGLGAHSGSYYFRRHFVKEAQTLAGGAPGMAPPEEPRGIWDGARTERSSRHCIRDANQCFQREMPPSAPSLCQGENCGQGPRSPRFPDPPRPLRPARAISPRPLFSVGPLCWLAQGSVRYPAGLKFSPPCTGLRPQPQPQPDGKHGAKAAICFLRAPSSHPFRSGRL